MSRCKKCGFYDSELGVCECPAQDRWYACPIESEKEENKKALEDYAREIAEKSFEYTKGMNDAVEWIVNNMPLDCYACPVDECFKNKNADCKTELLKKMKEEANGR